MPYFITINTQGRKVARPITSIEEFRQLRNDPKHLEKLAKARQGDDRAKHQCLNIMYQGHPNDDGTVKDSTRMSRHVFFDIDDKAEAQRVASLVMTDPEKWHLLMAETSIHDGLHLVFPRPWGMTILECQCQLALELHCEMDLNNKDATRMCFSTSADPSDLLYVSPELFTDTFDAGAWQREQTEMNARTEDLPEGAHKADKHFRPWEHNWPSHGIMVSQASTPSQPPQPSPQPSPQSSAAPQPNGTSFPTSYEGIPYTDITAMYWELFNDGKLPTEGGRNTLTFELAVNLRSLCDYNQQWLEAVIPRYDNLPEDEWRNIIHNALCEPRKAMPYRMRKVLDALRRQFRHKQSGSTANHPPQMPQRLTAFHKTLTRCTPDIYIPTVCEAAFPSLGAHLTGVQFRYIDGKTCEASFLNVLVKDMSVGKGSIDKPIEYINADIAHDDAVSRQREAEYKLKNPAGKSKRTKRPEDICIQILMSDTTNAAFVQRLIDAQVNGGRTLYMKVNEIEMLNQLRTNGTNIATLMKVAWDRDVIGQERVGSESVTGTAICRWNLNASTTPSRARRFLGPYVNDGTLTRLDLNTIDTPDDASDDIPIFKPYDQRYADALAPYIQRLKAASGLIKCRQAEQLARRMDRENKERAALYDSKAYRILSYRANVNAYKKAMVLYILNGMKWSKDIEEYVRWSLQWDLWVKLHYFGDIIDKALQADAQAVNPGPTNLLSQLPDPFTETDLAGLIQRMGRSSQPSVLLRQWKHRGYIQYDDTSAAWYKQGTHASVN